MYLVSATPTKLQAGVSLSEVTHSSSLFYHYVLFFFSKEDIEKYQEAEELYTKAMCLEQSSVEAREALRFLHYRKVCATISESN